MDEIKARLKKFKRRKAPGPDGIPMEAFKATSDENLDSIRDILNTWW